MSAEADRGAADWRQQRRAGMIAIAGGGVVAAGVWLAIRFATPPIANMQAVDARLVLALKCCAVAALFCLVLGVEAVAHERLQSAAFDPLAASPESRRLQVNLRYLQNTLEQFIVFAVGLFGLAVYCDGGEAMRAVLATTAVWILGRFAFWIGYHRSAALRGLGAPSMAVGMVVLVYVVARIGLEAAGRAGEVGAVGAFVAIEAFLMWTTRARR